MCYDLGYFVKFDIPGYDSNYWLTDADGNVGDISDALQIRTEEYLKETVKKVYNKIKEDFGVDTLKVFVERVQTKDIACWANDDLENL